MLSQQGEVINTDGDWEHPGNWGHVKKAQEGGAYGEAVRLTVNSKGNS